MGASCSEVVGVVISRRQTHKILIPIKSDFQNYHNTITIIISSRCGSFKAGDERHCCLPVGYHFPVDWDAWVGG